MSIFVRKKFDENENIISKKEPRLTPSNNTRATVQLWA